VTERYISDDLIPQVPAHVNTNCAGETAQMEGVDPLELGTADLNAVAFSGFAQYISVVLLDYVGLLLDYCWITIRLLLDYVVLLLNYCWIMLYYCWFTIRLLLDYVALLLNYCWIMLDYLLLDYLLLDYCCRSQKTKSYF
jgi:hypothetical protein